MLVLLVKIARTRVWGWHGWAASLCSMRLCFVSVLPRWQELQHSSAQLSSEETQIVKLKLVIVIIIIYTRQILIEWKPRQLRNCEGSKILGRRSRNHFDNPYHMLWIIFLWSEEEQGLEYAPILIGFSIRSARLGESGTCIRSPHHKQELTIVAEHFFITSVCLVRWADRYGIYPGRIRGIEIDSLGKITFVWFVQRNMPRKLCVLRIALEFIVRLFHSCLHVPTGPTRTDPIYLSICLSTYQSIYLPTYQSISLSIYKI